MVKQLPIDVVEKLMAVAGRAAERRRTEEGTDLATIVGEAIVDAANYSFRAGGRVYLDEAAAVAKEHGNDAGTSIGVEIANRLESLKPQEPE